MAALHPNADFSIEIAFEKGSRDPTRVFRAMTGLIQTFQDIDRSLCASIDISIQPILLLEDVEAGSIRTWLRVALEKIPDESLLNLDWRPVIGQYLVKAKRIFIDFTQDKSEINDKGQLTRLRDSLFEVAQQTQVRRIPVYQPIQIPILADGLHKLGNAVEPLREHDSVTVRTPDGDSAMNLSFRASLEKMEELLTLEVIESQEEAILKIKKPDYLGESMWDFRYGSRTISAKIVDEDWLTQFRNREVDIRPGDAIRAIMQKDVHYDHDRDVITEHNTVTKVIEVLRQPSHGQSDLLRIENSEEKF